MKHTSITLTAVAFLLAGLSAHAQVVDQTAEPAAEAHAGVRGVRIVRLSQVKGEVQLDRNVDHGFEPAFANLPITQGSKLKTAQGVAEVELEDNSTLRLTPDTTIEFTELKRNAAGFTSSTVNVVAGTLFVSMAPTKGNDFIVTSTQGKLALTPSTHLHFHVGSPQTTAAVLDGSVQAQVGPNTTTAGKKTTLLFDPANQAAPTLVSHLDKTPYDAWDKGSVDYHKRYMNTSSFGSSGSSGQLYGVSDLNYYGSFMNAAGCGSLWRPYLASAAWDPYGIGVLAYYPDAGYSWVSPYPWGWMPYHSGNWINCPGTGWGWQPGGNFNGLANTFTPLIQKRGILPSRPPVRGKSTLVEVSSQPFVMSKFADANTFVFARDSAGLGVPRETFGKLEKISNTTLERGTVTRAGYIAPVGPSARTGQPSVAFTRAGVNPAFSSHSSSWGSSGPHSSSGSTSGLSSGAALSSVSSPTSGAAHSGGASAGGAAHH
jgi:hypothetical protein